MNVSKWEIHKSIKTGKKNFLEEEYIEKYIYILKSDTKIKV